MILEFRDTAAASGHTFTDLMVGSALAARGLEAVRNTDTWSIVQGGGKVWHFFHLLILVNFGSRFMQTQQHSNFFFKVIFRLNKAWGSAFRLQGFGCSREKLDPESTFGEMQPDVTLRWPIRAGALTDHSCKTLPWRSTKTLPGRLGGHFSPFDKVKS